MVDNLYMCINYILITNICFFKIIIKKKYGYSADHVYDALMTYGIDLF